MTTFRNAIHKTTWACHIIDLETANLNDYVIDGLYWAEANNGAIDLNTKEAVDIGKNESKAKFIQQVNEEVITKAISKNKTNKQ